MAQKYEIIKYLLDREEPTCSKHQIINHLLEIGERVTHASAYLASFVEMGVLVNTLRGYRLSQEFTYLIATVGVSVYEGVEEWTAVGLETESDVYKLDVANPQWSRVRPVAGDIALIRVSKSDNTGLGFLETILVRTERLITGCYMPDLSGIGGVVQADSEIYDLRVLVKDGRQAQVFDRVAVRLSSIRPGMDMLPEAKLEAVLGMRRGAEISCEQVAQDFGLERGFTQRSLHQLDKVSSKIDESELIYRVSHVDECIFTIDGADAKDLDDAISICSLPNGGWRVGVHIADVAHYLKEGSALDREARQRGTSVYFIDDVFPMLPTKLSNQLCSLNPHELKLTLSVVMDLDADANVIKTVFEESYIRSCARLTYDDVTAFLREKHPYTLKSGVIDAESQQAVELALIESEQLAKKLKQKRIDRGALQFEFPESEFRVGEDGAVLDVFGREKGIANEIIESFMILANEAVASHFEEWELPFVYRVHDVPAEDRLEILYEQLEGLGYQRPLICTPTQIQALIAESEVRGEGLPVQLLILHAMKQARYHANCESHFGLASECYAHFTSPIRRYPDLQVHRILKDWIHRRLTVSRVEQLEASCEEVAKISSARERQAQRAENEYKRIKQMAYLESHLDSTFSALVVKIGEQECEVMLENTISGTLPYFQDARLPEFEVLKPGLFLHHLKSKQLIKLGDVVQLRVTRISVEESLVVFDLVCD